MKVLHVITGLGAGGAEQQLRLLLRHLPPEYHCDVVTLTNPGIVAAGLRADGVRVGNLAMRGNRDLAAVPRLARLIRREGYDVVHCHLYRASVYGRIAARLAGVRAIVTTEHSLLAQTIEGRRITLGVRALYLATERLGQCTVAVSQAVAERLADWGVPGHRVRVIPNGVGAARYRQPAPVRAATRQAVRTRLGLPQDAFVFGGVGRLVPGKRFDILVDALTLLPPGPPEPWLLLVGDGAERAALEQRARAAGVADRVVFAGERDDVPELLTAMDALAAPSTVETFGLALLEALAAGLPVRWSSGPALAELPQGAAPGARRTQAQPAAYAAELQELRSSRPRGAGRALPQPDAVRHYDMAHLAAAVADLYHHLTTPAPATTSPAPRPHPPQTGSPVPAPPAGSPVVAAPPAPGPRPSRAGSPVPAPPTPAPPATTSPSPRPRPPRTGTPVAESPAGSPVPAPPPTPAPPATASPSPRPRPSRAGSPVPAPPAAQAPVARRSRAGSPGGATPTAQPAAGAPATGASGPRPSSPHSIVPVPEETHVHH